MWLINLIRFPLRLFYKTFFGVKIIGAENIPNINGCIIACNHSSNHDPVILSSFIENRFIGYLAKKELFKFKVFGYFLGLFGAIPINRGLKDASVIKHMVEYLKNGNALCIFPEGTRIKKGVRIKAKKGSIRIAQLSGVPIIPVHIKGGYKLFKKTEIIVGKPFDIGKDENGEEKELSEKTNALMDLIYNL